MSAARLFVSSAVFTPNFGSLAVADQVCATLAQTAGLTRTYIALMSSGSTSAYSRLPEATRFFQVNAEGSPVQLAKDRDALFSSSSSGPTFNENEVSVLSGIGGVWTGMGANGSATGIDCNAWTTGTNPTQANVGVLGSSNSDWFNGGDTGCGTLSLHIYCAGI